MIALVEICVYTQRIYATRASDMRTTAKVFKSGNSQAVRLPKAFRFQSSEVEIFRRGDDVVLREKSQSLAEAFDALGDLPEGIWDDIRETRQPEDREPG